MNKKQKTMLKRGVALIILLTLIMPGVTNAALFSSSASSTKSSSNSMLSMVSKRYQDLNSYKKFIKDMQSYTNSINQNESVDEIKVKIIDKVTELKEQYDTSSVIPNISNQIINTTITTDTTDTKSLLNTIKEKLQDLAGNTGLVTQSLIPNEKVEIKATTAGEKCGTDFNVKLAANIYYADVDSNGNPTSDKWAFLVQASSMNGQSMADTIGQMYLDQGFNILAPDSRGNGDSGGSVAMGYVESLDVWDWLTYLNKQYPNKCNEIIIHGISIGGATTIFSSGLKGEVDGTTKTLKDQHVIGIVEDCGYTSLTEIIKGLLGGDKSDSTTTEAKTQLASQFLGLKDKNSLSSLANGSLVDSVIKKLLINKLGVGLTEENFDEYQDGLKNLAECEVPILIIHGTSDSIVPYANSERVYQTAMKNDKIKYVQRFSAEGEQHAFIVIGRKQTAYTNHVNHFIQRAEEVAAGKIVNKEENYTYTGEEAKTSAISKLVKALKLIKSMFK